MIVFGEPKESTALLNNYFESVKAVNINFNFLFHKLISLEIK
jgi:hypothetical protein